MGAIGGGPTFVGTVVVHGFTSEAVSVGFLTLAHGLRTGLIAGFLTDAIVTAAGHHRFDTVGWVSTPIGTPIQPAAAWVRH
jgi:hypothetical protein